MRERIFGKNPVLEALKAGRSLNKILILKSIGTSDAVEEIIRLSRKIKVPFEWVDKKIIDQKSGGVRHQGILAFASPKEYQDVEDILDAAKDKGEAPLIVVLDGIEDPHNLGAIIRTAECAGAHGVIIPKRRASPLTETVAKTSAGAIEHIAVARVTNIRDEIKKLKEKGIWVVGLDERAEKSLTQADLKLPTAIVIGSEGKGMSKHIKESCELLVSIPMKGKIGSLNASVAASIIMYEAVRQRA